MQDPGAPKRARGQRPPAVHLNLNVRGMGWSATIAINERSAALAAEGRDVYRLGLGQSPFPVPEVVVEALRENAHQKDYLPVTGLAALREAVAEHHRRVEGVDRSADAVLVGPGSKELMFLLQLVYYGDLVIPTPAWVSYAPQAQIIGRRVEFLHTSQEEGWLLSPERLDSFCAKDPDRPRIVILNYPSNPTGATYKLDELKELAKVARKYGLVLLSDEIYGAVHHRGQHVSVARFYPEGTILSSGLSKWCGAGGWRLGTFLFPPGMDWLRDAMAAAASETYTSYQQRRSSTPPSARSRAAPRSTPISPTRAGILGALARACTQTLRSANLDVQDGKGGFYLFPSFDRHREALAARGITTGTELTEALLTDTGVATLPASCFGRPDTELALRMAYVDFDGAAALTAAAHQPRNTPLPTSWLDTHATPTMTAMRLMAEWTAAL